MSAHLQALTLKIVGGRMLGELVLGDEQDLRLLRDLASRGTPAERTAAAVVLETVGLPVEPLDPGDELAVRRARRAARSAAG